MAAGTFFLILSGGDPFTRKDFMKIVQAARKRRMSTTIFTNGLLITKLLLTNYSVYISILSISVFIVQDQNCMIILRRFPAHLKKVYMLLGCFEKETLMFESNVL